MSLDFVKANYAGGKQRSSIFQRLYKAGAKDFRRNQALLQSLRLQKRSFEHAKAQGIL